MTGPRNWDKELADIDKLMGSSAASPPASGGAPQSLPAPRTATSGSSKPVAAQASAPARRRDTVIVWLKAGLGASGAAALAVWPYNKACGMMLYGFLVGVSAVLFAGVWTMRAGWVHRRGWGHIVGVLTMLAALVLLAVEVLPRTGYTTPAKSWICPSTP